jgi:hypothetical protein
MIRVYVVCEGQTEENFIKQVISPIFAINNIFLTPRTIQTSKGFSGGALSYDRIRNFIEKCLKEDRNVFVTTFFDLYGLQNNFPGFEQACKLTNPYDKATKIESALKQDISSKNNLFAERLFPYIQPYEFEGLLFSELCKLTELEPDWNCAFKKLQLIRDSVESPEHINDSYETKPSQRIKQALFNPAYRKTYHGPLAAKRIGLDKLCAECKHFAGWYQQLANLGAA